MLSPILEQAFRNKKMTEDLSTTPSSEAAGEIQPGVCVKAVGKYCDTWRQVSLKLRVAEGYKPTHKL